MSLFKKIIFFIFVALEFSQYIAYFYSQQNQINLHIFIRLRKMSSIFNNQENLHISKSDPKSPLNEYRITYLKPTSAVLFGLLTAYGNRIPSATAAVQIGVSPRPFLYSIQMTDPPCLQPRTTTGEESTLEKLSGSDIILIGIHSNDQSIKTIKNQDDVVFATNIIERIIKKKPQKHAMIALSDIPFNEINLNALNSYTKSDSIDDDIAINQLLSILSSSDSALDYARWIPVFRAAKKYQLQIIPAGIPPNILNLIREKGIQGLSDDLKASYVNDREGFLKSVIGEGFKKYTEKVILSSYYNNPTITTTINTNTNTTNPENYFSSKILQHEFAACITAKYSYADGKNYNLVILISPELDVKFGYGIQERIERNLDYLRSPVSVNSQSNIQEEKDKRSGSNPSSVSPNPSSSSITENKVYSILTNPTAADSLSDTVQLRLVLAYGPFLKYQRPLADYLWFSEYPSVRLLTRPKNPINREGDKPAGESSIIGAF